MFTRMFVVSFAVVAMAAAPPVPPRLDRHGDPLPMHAMARLGTMRLRHPGGIAGLAFSPDGKYLGSNGAGGVRVCRVGDGRLLPYLNQEHGFAVVRGERLSALIESQDGKLVWHDALSGRDAGRTRPQPQRGVAPIYSPDRKMQAQVGSSGGDADTVRFTDLTTNEPAGSIKGKTDKGIEFMSLTATFSRDGTRL